MSHPVLFGGLTGTLAAGICAPIVYGLSDPADPARVRYVGKTASAALRYGQHVVNRRAASGRWITDLMAEGRAPIMVLLESVAEPSVLREREREWIRRLKADGQADLNGIWPPRPRRPPRR